MKTYYNKQGKPVTGKHFTRLDGKIELNPGALSAIELAEKCGLYTFEQVKIAIDETVTGKLVYNEKKGTCTLERRKLTKDEIAARKADEAEALLRAEFEAEQEAEKEEKFNKFKDLKQKKLKKPPVEVKTLTLPRKVTNINNI